ncbi:MAG: LLM class flavin-dependent oxidoreductase [Dehalococcoidia bacterium]|nr:LLM class flavin-dependent oxidoreductase [Dehalococcoidia bacterium]
MNLGILDQSPIRRGGTATQAISETLELAEFADRLGYSRYWLSEHHASGGLASATPEILIGEIASRTKRIRVGSGGVMLTHYSPLKVAETFRMLEVLHPGRIDLGVGRAPGSDTRTARALAHGPGQLPLEAYPDQLADLWGFLTDGLPPDHRFAGITAIPHVPTTRELWVLGSSDAGAMYAAELGWRFCYAHFINPLNGLEAMDAYRERFVPGPVIETPHAGLAVSAVAADTKEEAERLSWSRWAWRIAGQRGGAAGIPTPEDAMAFPYTPSERDYLEYTRSQAVFGTGTEVRERLLDMAAEYRADELVIVTITHDFQARKRSYELLAEAFNLERQA